MSRKLTDCFICLVGTHQCCEASLKIFTIFVNDLIQYLHVLVYVDEVSSIEDTVLRLQKQIDSIPNFSKELDMNKSKIIVFRNGGTLRRSEECLTINK